MWWRLLQFLGNINFTSNLEVIKENGLLDQIYNELPDEIKHNVLAIGLCVLAEDGKLTQKEIDLFEDVLL